MNYLVLFQHLVAELRQGIGTVMKHSRAVINSSTCRKSLNLELQTLVMLCLEQGLLPVSAG